MRSYSLRSDVFKSRVQLQDALGSNFQLLLNAVSLGELRINEDVNTDRGEKLVTTVNLGVIQGPVLIRDDLARCIRKCDDLTRTIAQLNIQSWNGFDLTRHVKVIRRQYKALLDECGKLRNAPQFFADSNIRRISRWGLSVGIKIDLDISRNKIIIRNSTDVIREIEVIDGVVLPDLPVTNLAVAALS